jgi:uncharacterized cofD-like protein
MSNSLETNSLRQCLETLTSNDLSPLDFLTEGSTEEKIVGLVLNGPPAGVSPKLVGLFHETLKQLSEMEADQLRVVTLGGGSGLSNIVGGDSRRTDWQETPFTGLKEIFPGITSIVCVTDDGGSTGELLKYLPFVGLGDLRHVLVSSVRREKLQDIYRLDDRGAGELAAALHRIFNYRFHVPGISAGELLYVAGFSDGLPVELQDYFSQLVARLFSDSRLKKTLARPQCLGNLLLASAMLGCVDPAMSVNDLLKEPQMLHQATIDGLREVSQHIGVDKDGVLPCTTTPAQLQMLYANGVLVTGENKSGFASRGYPVDRAIVEFYSEPYLPPEVERVIREADIIIYAPGSLYTSIIPILQVPGIAESIRQNNNALKILISNIWVQKGETDATRDAPERKFHISDLVRAYNRNIPGGVHNLFSHILTLDLGEIPGSVLQNYAIEDKEPICLDRQRLREIGFEPVEAGIFSTDKLHRRHVIQHDPSALAAAVCTLWRLHQEKCLSVNPSLSALPATSRYRAPVGSGLSHPCQRFEAIENWLAHLVVQRAENGNGSPEELDEPERSKLLADVSEILSHHSDVLPEHLDYTRGIVLVEAKQWHRSQQWDNIFSFYDPQERLINIREDQTATPERFAMAFLIALGQSLLGNYIQNKTMDDVLEEGEQVGRVYRLVIREEHEYSGFFNMVELDLYLSLARMRRSRGSQALYTRLVNSNEGFTPPGLLFGLFYTWYLDNRFAGNIEYKMSIMRNAVSDMIPEQVKIVDRREGLVSFFREKVFRHNITLEQPTV